MRTVRSTKWKHKGAVVSAIDRGQVNTEMIELITIGRKKVALKTKS